MSFRCIHCGSTRPPRTAINESDPQNRKSCGCIGAASIPPLLAVCITSAVLIPKENACTAAAVILGAVLLALMVGGGIYQLRAVRTHRCADCGIKLD